MSKPRTSKQPNNLDHVTGGDCGATICSAVLESHSCNTSRAKDKHGNERMICAKCGDRRYMKNYSLGVYECRGCKQLWKYPNTK